MEGGGSGSSQPARPLTATLEGGGSGSSQPALTATMEGGGSGSSQLARPLKRARPDSSALSDDASNSSAPRDNSSDSSAPLDNSSDIRAAHGSAPAEDSEGAGGLPTPTVTGEGAPTDGIPTAHVTFVCEAKRNRRHPKRPLHWIGEQAQITQAFSGLLHSLQLQVPITLHLIGKGQNRLAFQSPQVPGVIWKVGPSNGHGNEATISREFPDITVEVLWELRIHATIGHGTDQLTPVLDGLVQRRVALASRTLGDKPPEGFFLAALARLALAHGRGYMTRDTGVSNMALPVDWTLATQESQESFPIQLFDLASWTQEQGTLKNAAKGLLRWATEAGHAESLHQVLRQHPSTPEVLRHLRSYLPTRYQATV